MKRLTIMLLGGITAGWLFLSGCVTPRGAYDPSYDFTRVHTIAVGDFSASSKRHPNSGSSIANEFIKQLLREGYSVRDDNGEADVILVGSVNEYLPNKRYLVQHPRPDEHGNVVVVEQSQTVTLSGNSVYNLGPAFGTDDSQILVSNATVGISAYLKDAKTGRIVWSNSISYEGLDLNAAMEGAVRNLVLSLPKRQ
jgi:hypothetical protein